MYRLIVLLLVSFQLLFSNVYGQSTLEQSLQKVASVAEAKQYVRDHPPLQASLRVLRPSSDTAATDRQLYRLAVGEVRSIGQQTYKTIADTTTYAFRASYIYLDGSQLSTATIDSLRRLILRRYAAGIAFEHLADTYNMDGNKNHGDLGFFPPAGWLCHSSRPFVRTPTGKCLRSMYQTINGITWSKKRRRTRLPGC
jgi:hypothetical protein